MVEEDSKCSLDLSDTDLSSWLCPSCQYCELCSQPSATNNRLAKCVSCKFMYHPACLAPHYPVPKKKLKNHWICSRCVKCEDCGATHPGRGLNAQWSEDFKYCQSCNDKRGLNFCPECKEYYSPDDYTLRMLQCQKCDMWVHAKPCAEMSDDLYDLFELLPDSVHFVCLTCAKKVSLHRPLVWEVRVQRLLADKLGEALADFLQHIQTICGEIQEEAEATVPEELEQCKAALVAMELEEQKEIMQSMCERLVQAKYREIAQFIFDFWQILDAEGVSLLWLCDTWLRMFPNISNDMKKRVKQDVMNLKDPKPESPEKKKTQAKKVQDTNNEEKPKANKPLNKLNSTIMKNAASVNHNSEDTRLCRLCCRFGDSSSQEAGRLLYVGQDDWVHVNCALWSAEVFERGSFLCNVTSALCRSRHLKCCYCGRTGATLQCREQGCRRDFHFMCARENDHEFTDEHVCYCPDHFDSDNEDDDELGIISDFSVDRRLICEPDGIRWRRNWLDGFNSQEITIIVGSLTIVRLGSICELSDLKHALIPVNLAVERVHWDLDNPLKLTVYRCGIDAIQSPNSDDPCDIATTIVIKTPTANLFNTPRKSQKQQQLQRTPVRPTMIPSPQPPVRAMSSASTTRPQSRPTSSANHQQPFVVWSGNTVVRQTPSELDVSQDESFQLSNSMEVERHGSPIGSSPDRSPVIRASSSPIQPQQQFPVNSPMHVVSPPKPLESPTPARKSPISPQAVARVRRIIDASPSRSNQQDLMRVVQQSPIRKNPESPSLSRTVPFAHLQTQRYSFTMSNQPVYRPTILRPKSGSRSSTPIKHEKIELKPLPPVGMMENVEGLDQTVVEVLDHIVSRIAYETGDFNRHGNALLKKYESPVSTVLHSFKTISAIGGKVVTSVEFNDFMANTLLGKYKMKVRNRNNCIQQPPPWKYNPTPMRRSSDKPAELDLFPVSIFPVPKTGPRAIKHQEVMNEIEKRIKETKSQTDTSSPVQPLQNNQQQAKVEPEPPKPIVPKFRLVSQAGANGPRVFQLHTGGSIRVVRPQPPSLQAVRPIVVQQGQQNQQPRPTQLQRVIGETPGRSSFPLGQRMIIRPPFIPNDISKQMQRADNVPLTMKAVSMTNAAVPTPPFLRVNLPPISPDKDTSHVVRQPSLTFVPPPQSHSYAQPVAPRQQHQSPVKTHWTPPSKTPPSPWKPSFAKSEIPTSSVPLPTSAPAPPRPVQSPPRVEKKLKTAKSPIVKKQEKISKRKEPVKKQGDLVSESLMSENAVAAKKAAVNPPTDNKKTNKKHQMSAVSKPKTVAQKPKIPFGNISNLVPSPTKTKATLPPSESALSELVNRVVSESVVQEGEPITKVRRRRYLVFDIAPANMEKNGKNKEDKDWKIRGFTWQDSWRCFFDRLSHRRKEMGLSKISYDSLTGLSMYGLTHSSVVALLEQLPCVEEETHNYQFRFAKYERISPNPSGCARAQPFTVDVDVDWRPGQRRHRDVFSFLLSYVRKPRLRSDENEVCLNLLVVKYLFKRCLLF